MGWVLLAERAQAKEVFRKWKSALLCIQKTKLEMVDRYVLRNLGVRGDWGFSFVESKGASGGIIVAWEESVWSLVDKWKGNYSLSTVLLRKEDASCVIFSGVYGPSLGAEKKLLWEDLNGIRAPKMEERLGRWWASYQSEGPSDVRIGKKLRFVKEKLRAWVKEQRLKDQTCKVWLERRIGEISGLEEAGQGSGNLREELGRIKEEHNGLLLHEEIFWRQKSRVRWLKEGDKNSAYFHAVASVRRRKNIIESLVDNGVEVSGKDEITKVVLQFYKSLYSSEGGSRPTPVHMEFSSLDLSMCMELEKSFEKEEIERGIFIK
ncbi:uncharacterized protein LOC143886026 [Tasmannia lanceolata]|uniref:uncharacterized protein LOC143886026 n=1 Tax=Tasmannia lanceolata TaxID=3420 RepID=UPI0040633338